MDPARFVFLDETGTTTNMTRRYGRCPSDQRLVAAVPHGHWRSTTFVAGLRQTGIVAPLVLDGPMTGPAFRAYHSFLVARLNDHVYATWLARFPLPKFKSIANHRRNGRPRDQNWTEEHLS